MRFLRRKQEDVEVYPDCNVKIKCMHEQSEEVFYMETGGKCKNVFFTIGY